MNNGALGSYGYDGNGKRVKKTESGTTTYYVISSVLGAAMEVTAAGVQRAYVMSGGSVVAQLNGLQARLEKQWQFASRWV